MALHPQAAAAEPAVERGRYIAAASNCIGCHTRAGGVAYAGGRPILTPLGTIHSTNITRDEETGIGSWSEQDLRRALREGIAADGRHLFPVFPYPSYTRLGDADIADLYAWLRTLEPVRYTPPANDFVFSLRWPLALWNALYLEPGPWQADPARPAEWNRGAYLVQGPGHCGACHTPRNALYAEQPERALHGTVMQDVVPTGGARDWFAVDLRATAQGLAAWKTEHLVGYFRRGYSARAASFGPMNEVIATGLGRLSDEDLRALAVYLQSLEGDDYAGESVGADQAQAGSADYEEHCRECHGPSGRGGIFDGPPLAGSAVVQGESAASLINIVLHGSDKPAGLGSPSWEDMPAYAAKLDDERIAALCNFLRGSWGNRASPVTPETVARQR